MTIHVRILILIFTSLTYLSIGQTLEFTKGKKKPLILKKYFVGTVKLKDGNSYSGYVDTVMEKEIHLKVNGGSYQTITPEEIYSVKQCKYFLYIGEFFHVFRRCKRTNLTSYKYKYRPKR